MPGDRFDVVDDTDNPELIHVEISSADDRHILALKGFTKLANDARPFAPFLIRLVSNADKNIRIASLSCLIATHPENKVLLPVLLQLLHDPDRDLQRLAFAEITVYYPDQVDQTRFSDFFPDASAKETNKPTHK